MKKLKGRAKHPVIESQAVGFTVGEKERKVKVKHFKFAAVLALVILLLASLPVALRWQYDKNHACSISTLKHARTYLEKSDKTSLQKLALSISKTPGYLQDANCLYVLTQNSLLQGKPDEARTALDELKKVYDSKKGYNRALGKDLRSIDDLEKLVSGSEATNPAPQVYRGYDRVEEVQ